MKSFIKKYYNFITLLLLSPILIFILINSILGFNGLYGQDSHEYYRYSRAVQDFLLTGNSPGDYFWPVYYPILGAIFGFLTNILFSLQLISVLSLSGSMFFLFKTMKRICNDDGYIPIYLVITFLLSPYVFRNSFVVMSDLMTVFFITASFYFFIDYLQNTEVKQVILFSVFSAVAVLTRYAAAVVLLIPACIILYHIIKTGKYFHLVSIIIIILTISIPHILIRESKVTEFLGHSWLQDWSLSNFFKNDFITLEGTRLYRFTNIIYSFSGVFYPTYMVFGLVLVVLSERNLPKNKYWLIAVGIVLLNAFFLAGIPFQNQRYLLLAYPFVIISVFPGFERLLKLLQNRRRLFYSVIYVMLILQIFFCVYFFKQVYERNVLEKEIADYVRIDQHKNVYGFDIDISFGSYDVNKNVINMWKEKISQFDTNSIVVFNETKFKDQWADKNPMINWNNLKSNYTLIKLKDFGGGWQVYEIK